MKKMWMYAMAASLLLVGGAFGALREADLTASAVRATIAAKPAAERQAYARQVLEAIASQPIDDAEKAEKLVKAARALLSGANMVSIIAEIYNSVPVAFLQGVSDLLQQNNFAQALQRDKNGVMMANEQYDALCEKIVSTASRYIEASGTDSPTVRVSILAATFSKGSTDPERTRKRMIAALPVSMQAAAATYIAASERNDVDMLAAATGVDEVVETPADPDAEHVVQVAPAEGAAVAGEGAAEEGSAAAEQQAAAEPVDPELAYLEPEAPVTEQRELEPPMPEVEAAVPMLSRFASDALGIAFDSLLASMYDWEEPGLTPPAMSLVSDPEQMVGAGEFGIATQPRPLPSVPDLPPPSPTYGNQYIYNN